MEDKDAQKQEDQKRFYNNPTTKMREFSPGQKLLVENLRSTTPKWITGKIKTKTGLDPLSYRVEIDDVIHRCQMLPSKAQVMIIDKSNEDLFLPIPVC